MMKRTGVALMLTLAALSPRMVRAQADIHFSQFYETSILRNPSLTGIFSNDFKVGAYYRNQWASISHPFVTMSAYGEFRVPIGHYSNDYLSLGILGFSDKAGSLQQSINSVYPAINFSKSLNAEHNSFLSVGFTAGYTQYSYDKSGATTNAQYQGNHFDPNNPTFENFLNNKMTLWDLGAGINYNASTGETNDVTYVIGVSGYHLTQPNFSYYQTQGVTANMRWNVNGAIAFDVKSNIAIQLHSNFALQGTYREIMAGGLVTLTEEGVGDKPTYAVTAGVFYRVQDAIIPVVRLKYKRTSVGLSYDVNNSTLKEASKLRGGYELTFAFTGNFGGVPGVVKKTVCPKF